jgi:hemoglobin
LLLQKFEQGNYKAYVISYNFRMLNSQPSIYELIGGEPGLRKLVERFYDLIDSSPEAAQIRALHPKSLKQSREKFFMFLSGWSGGPSLYVEKYGHPRLRMRHMPFSIGVVERDQWLWCMNKSLDEMRLDPLVLEHLKARFTEAADFLRNRREE